MKRESGLNQLQKLMVIFSITLLSLMVLTSCGSEAKAAAEALEAAKESFSIAAESLEKKNTKVDEAISSLQGVMASEVSPLDESTIPAAEEAISKAQAAKAAAPEMAETTDEINTQVEKLDSIDYSEQLASLQEAKNALENSIKQHEQVINPSEAFVIQRLTEVEHILTPTAATEDNDPNTLLHKQGGYNASVFFATDLFDASQIPEAYGVGVVGRGVEDGGEVEVYDDEAGAIARDAYIAQFDGTWLAPGSHAVCGSCVIRTSKELTATEQKELEAAIVDALTRLE